MPAAIIAFDQWIETYKPILGADGEIKYFETYGEDYEVIKTTPYSKIWTQVDSDDGDSSVIVSGARLVNRINYIICKEPFDTTKHYQVLD